jgi:hypothetical protein
MKYSLTKHVEKEALSELFEILSDSFMEEIPDVIWAGSAFEVKIPAKDVHCRINFINTKKGGEFTIKITWLGPDAEEEEEDNKRIKKLLKKTGETQIIEPEEEGDEGITYVEQEEVWPEEADDFSFKPPEEWDDSDYEDDW